ncbi:hypothetical protein ACHAWF_014928 [Thalassiosira exigua]
MRRPGSSTTTTTSMSSPLRPDRPAGVGVDGLGCVCGARGRTTRGRTARRTATTSAASATSAPPLLPPSRLPASAPVAVVAFQTPIIFPLLWMAKRLTHRRIGGGGGGGGGVVAGLPAPPPPLFLLPPLSALASGLRSLVAPPASSSSSSAMAEARLLSWLSSHGADVDAVSIRTDDDRGLRGLYAARDLRSGEIVVEIPYDAAVLTGDTLRPVARDDFSEAEGSEGWDADDLEDAYQGLNFWNSFAKDDVAGATGGGGGAAEGFEGGKWAAPYVKGLPPQPSSSDDEDVGLTPDFWPDETIRSLQIPSFVERILNRKRIVEEVAKRNHVNEDDLRWATWMIRSRRFTTWNVVDAPDDYDYDGDDEKIFGVFPTRRRTVEQIQGYLLPLVDMANHAHEPNAALKISVNRWTRKFDDTSSFALRALKPIRKGEEVTISYGEGDRTSLELVDKYGFFLENNPADAAIDWDELKPAFDASWEDDERELARLEETAQEERREARKRGRSTRRGRLRDVASKWQDARGASFPPTLDDMERIGSGVRRKMGINVYSVAMYGPPSLKGAASRSELRDAARAFDDSSSRTTTFVLELILKADPDTVAAALADSVRSRYDGPPADAAYLESLVAESLRGRGTEADGTVLRFDCSKDGVGVRVGGAAGRVEGSDRGATATTAAATIAKFEGLGEAFCDVFLDEEGVSPSLIESCLDGGGGGGEPTAAAARGASDGAGDRGGGGSRRAMLSLRTLAKRLSGWKGSGPSPTAAVGVDAAVVDADALDPADATIEGGGASVAAEAVPVSAEETLAEDEADAPEPVPVDETDEPVASEEVAEPVDAIEGGAPIDASAEPTIEPAERPAEELAERPDPVPDIPAAEAVAPPPPPPPADVAPPTTLSASDFDATSVEARIRLLEAEIRAEMERVRTGGGGVAPPIVAAASSEAPAAAATAAVAPPAPIARGDVEAVVVQPVPGVEAAAPDVAVESQTLPEEATAPMEAAIEDAVEEDSEDAAERAETLKRNEAVESKMKPLKDKATGVEFAPKLDDGLYLAGVGVRKKAIINVYSLAMYASSRVLASLSPYAKGKKADAQAALRDAARTFDASSPATTFVLEMVFKADAQAIAGAIAEGVKPRYDGSADDVSALESLIVEGVRAKGGQATKGTVFRFDCTADGVEVSVDGVEQGMASGEGMGSAFVDVFADGKARLKLKILPTGTGDRSRSEQKTMVDDERKPPPQASPAEDRKMPAVAMNTEKSPKKRRKAPREEIIDVVTKLSIKTGEKVEVKWTINGDDDSQEEGGKKGEGSAEKTDANGDKEESENAVSVWWLATLRGKTGNMYTLTDEERDENSGANASDKAGVVKVPIYNLAYVPMPEHGFDSISLEEVAFVSNQTLLNLSTDELMTFRKHGEKSPPPSPTTDIEEMAPSEISKEFNGPDEMKSFMDQVMQQCLKSTGMDQKMKSMPFSDQQVIAERIQRAKDGMMEKIMEETDKMGAGKKVITADVVRRCMKQMEGGY